MAPRLSPPPPPGTGTTATATATTHRRGPRRSQEERGSGKKPQPQGSNSFHGKTPVAPSDKRQTRRPKTQPDLLAPGGTRSCGGLSQPEVRRGNSASDKEGRRVPAKVLVNVAVQRSLGRVQVMASTEWRVEELAAAAARLYVKEGRHPPLPTAEPTAFNLHYSQFSLECLDPKVKLIELGSRNFFLCPKSISASAAPAPACSSSSSPPEPRPLTPSPSSPSSCSKEADKASKLPVPWLRFMVYLL